MSHSTPDEYDDDRFEDHDAWLDDFDDRDDGFDARADARLLDDLGIDFSNLGPRKRLDPGLLLGGAEDEDHDEEIAA
jgi:hypothetical protein